MPITTAGQNYLVACMTGVNTTLLNNANAQIGVGDSATVFDIAQTDLQADTNKLRVGMDATYPLTVANVITLKATFTELLANFPWQEWGIFNAATEGDMLCRKVEYNGTKLSGQIWVITVTVTISIS